MKFFESKYTLGVTLGLVCFQMYLTKSSEVDYNKYTPRYIANEAGEFCNYKYVSNLEVELIKDMTDRSCFFSFDKDSRSFVSLRRVTKDNGEISYLGAKQEVSVEDLNNVGITTDENGQITGTYTGSQISTLAPSVLAAMIDQHEVLEVAGSSLETQENLETNDALDTEGTIAADEPRAVEEALATEAPLETQGTLPTQGTIATENAEETLSITRTEVKNILREYNKILKDIDDAKEDCTLSDEDIFADAEDRYAELSEILDGEIKCDDRSCSNLEQEDIKLITDLNEQIEDFEGVEDFLAEERKEVDSCKSDRLKDRDFLEEYSEDGKCDEQETSSTSFTTAERRRPRPRFTRNGESRSTSRDESFSSLQVCYYQKEILPSIREELASGNPNRFDSASETINELASSLGGTSSKSNQAIVSSIQFEKNIALSLIQYEDQLWDRIEEVQSSENLTAQQKTTLIQELKDEAATNFLKIKEQAESVILNGNSMQAERDLINGSNGAFGYWGKELASINNERAPLPSNLDVLSFSGLSTATTSSIDSLLASSHENSLRSADDSINAALGEARSATDRQIEYAQRRFVEEGTSDQDGRLLRSSRPPGFDSDTLSGDDRSNGNRLGRNGPLDSHMVDENRRPVNRSRFSQGNTNRSRQGGFDSQGLR